MPSTEHTEACSSSASHWDGRRGQTCECSADMKKAVEQLKAAVAASTSTSSQAVTDAVATVQKQLAAAAADTAPAILEGDLWHACVEVANTHGQDRQSCSATTTHHQVIIAPTVCRDILARTQTPSVRTHQDPQ